jgi:TetR/AcrR family transcriptional regulator, cholesterol catabolism regulator
MESKSGSKARRPATSAAKGASRAKTTKAGAKGRASAGSLNGARTRDSEVIEAAVQIFWKKGYASASVQDVADALGMLKGSLYYYIDSKESLLFKIFEDSHDALMALTEEAVEAEGSAVDRLTRFLHGYAMWTLTHLERAALYSREWRYASDKHRAELSEQQRYYDRALRKLIMAGQEEGDLDAAVDPRRASLFIWAAFTGLPDWYHAGTKSEAEQVAATYVDLALRACGGVPTLAPAKATPARKRTR